MRRAKLVDRKQTISKLKREADRVFSLWIRKRDGRCVVCRMDRQPTAGHLLSRRLMSVRWDEENVNQQCWPCNYLHRHRPEIYTAWFIGWYGEEKYLALVERSKQLKQFKRHELEQIIEKYK